MSFDKSIRHGKESRRPYRGSAAFDYSCRPQGSCRWCRSNRRFAGVKASGHADLREQEIEWMDRFHESSVDL